MEQNIYTTGNNFYYKYSYFSVQAYLGVRVPDNCNKVTIAINQVAQIFWLPSAYKTYVYTTL